MTKVALAPGRPTRASVPKRSWWFALHCAFTLCRQATLRAPLPRHFEKNAPGAFYTTGKCLACGAPEAEAPQLLAPLEGDNYDTYFVRQPSTPGEVEQACRALEVCCVNALRYRGQDPAIIRRLGNDPQYCDYLSPGGPLPTPPWRRDEVQPRSKRWWQFWRT